MQRGRCITLILAVALFFGLAATAWAAVPPPPVNQTLGMPDRMFNDFLEADCRFCHNQNPPIAPVDPTYLPDRHHLNVGGTILLGECNKVEVCNIALSTCNDGTTACDPAQANGSCSVTTTTPCATDGDCPAGETCEGQNPDVDCETAAYGPTSCTNDQECRDLSGLFDDYCTGESQVRNPDADNNGTPDTTYDCLNCHNIQFNPGTGTFEIVDDFRDCTNCHQVQFQPDHPDRTQEPNVHHRKDEALVDRNCQYCHGSLVDAGWLDDDGDTIRNSIDYDDLVTPTNGWVPTYNPSLVTPWPSEKAFGSCVVTGVCDVGVTDVCTAGDVGAACTADADCDVDTLVFCAGDEGNYCQAGEVCVQDETTYGGGGAALGRHAEGNCNACHDATLDPAANTCVGYDPNLPDTPGACSVGGADCFKDADCYGPILINHDTHHFTGLTAAGCETCHPQPPGRPSHTAQDIRACENCHGIPSLHNIQVESDDADAVITVGAENPYFGHIGSQTDCNGCHGFEALTLSLAPQSGPVVPFIGSADDAGTEANTPTTVTVGGVAFTNTTMGMPFTSEAVLDGSSENLAVSVTESEMVVELPGLDAGTYMLRAKKYQKKSNPLVIAVTPEVVVDSVNCADGAATIAGSGFARYLEAGNSPTKVTGEVTVGRGKKKTVTETETAQINSWTDTEIVAQFSVCPNDGTVAVSTVWDITGGGSEPPPLAVCSDYEDQASCNADANCHWNKKKGCLDG